MRGRRTPSRRGREGGAEWASTRPQGHVDDCLGCLERCGLSRKRLCGGLVPREEEGRVRGRLEHGESPRSFGGVADEEQGRAAADLPPVGLPLLGELADVVTADAHGQQVQRAVERLDGEAARVPPVEDGPLHVEVAHESAPAGLVGREDVGEEAERVPGVEVDGREGLGEPRPEADAYLDLRPLDHGPPYDLVAVRPALGAPEPPRGGHGRERGLAGRRRHLGVGARGRDRRRHDASR